MGNVDKNDFTFKTQPLKHQLDALCQSATKQNFAYLMEMGCVDGETEFLSNRGWVKFKDFELSKWEEPLLVAQAETSEYQSNKAFTSLSLPNLLATLKKKLIRCTISLVSWLAVQSHALISW